jgi:hypothetical protein
MGYYDPDVYHSPEVFGLTPVGEVEWYEPDYSFDFAVVWYHAESGKFYWGSDSGCSCPSPFEDYTSLDKLESGTWWDVAKGLVQHHDYYFPDGNTRVENEIASVIVKMREVMRNGD